MWDCNLYVHKAQCWDWSNKEVQFWLGEVEDMLCTEVVKGGGELKE